MGLASEISGSYLRGKGSESEGNGVGKFKRVVFVGKVSSRDPPLIGPGCKGQIMRRISGDIIGIAKLKRQVEVLSIDLIGCLR